MELKVRRLNSFWTGGMDGNVNRIHKIGIHNISSDIFLLKTLNNYEVGVLPDLRVFTFFKIRFTPLCPDHTQHRDVYGWMQVPQDRIDHIVRAEILRVFKSNLKEPNKWLKPSGRDTFQIRYAGLLKWPAKSARQARLIFNLAEFLAN